MSFNLGGFFTFCDKETSIGVEIKCKKYETSPFIKEKKFIKIINPSIEEGPRRLIINESTQVKPSGFVKTTSDFSLHENEDTTEIEVTSMQTAQQMEPDQVCRNYFL